VVVEVQKETLSWRGKTADNDEPIECLKIHDALENISVVAHYSKHYYQSTLYKIYNEAC